MKEDTELTWQERCCSFTVRVGLNAFVVLLVAGSGLLIWFLLCWENGIEDPTAGAHETPMTIPIIITIIMMVAPVLFSWMTRYDYWSLPHEIWLCYRYYAGTCCLCHQVWGEYGDSAVKCDSDLQIFSALVQVAQIRLQGSEWPSGCTSNCIVMLLTLTLKVEPQFVLPGVHTEFFAGGGGGWPSGYV